MSNGNRTTFKELNFVPFSIPYLVACCKMRNPRLLLGVTAGIVLCLLSSTSATKCKQWLQYFASIEHALVNKEDNLIKLSDAFRPTNTHGNDIVEVKYVLLPFKNQSELRAVDPPKLDLGNGIEDKDIKHRVLRQAEECTSKNVSLHFRWTNSPVYLFINADLLHQLSLLTYIPFISRQVELSFSTPCSCEELKSFLLSPTKGCPDKNPALDLFNNLTSNVS